MKTRLVVNQANGNALNVDGLDILKRVYRISNDKIIHANDAGAIPSDPHGNVNFEGKKFEIHSASDWAKMADMLYKNALQPNKARAIPLNQKFKYAYIQIGGDDQNIVRIFCGQKLQPNNPRPWQDKRIVEFPGDLGSYAQITQSIIQTIFPLIPNNQNNKHVALARKLKAKIRNPDNNYPAYLNNNQKFLNCLLVLICIVEPSRHSAMLAYAMMLLDLIQKSPGRIPQRNFTWNNMFVSEKHYRWDDFEQKGYSGKYPGAVNSTGSGNFTEAAGILIEAPNYNHFTTELLLQEHQHHAAILRGMRLTLYWLMLFDPEDFRGDALVAAMQALNLQAQPPANANANLLIHIEDIITTHLNKLFVQNIPLNENMKFKVAAVNLAPAPNNPLVIPPADQLCYYFSHQVVAANPNTKTGHYFHRPNYACKLVSEYVRDNVVKNNVYLQGIGQRNIKSTALVNRVAQAQARGLRACPCCYNTSHTNRVSRPIVVAYKNNQNTYHKTMLGQVGACYQDFFADTVRLSRLTAVPERHGNPRTPCQTCWPAPGGLPPAQSPDRLTLTM